MPVAKNNRKYGLRPVRDNASCSTMPIKSEPLTLMTKVPHGKLVPTRATNQLDIKYRRTDPSAPPIATAAIATDCCMRGQRSARAGKKPAGLRLPRGVRARRAFDRRERRESDKLA